MQGRVGDGPAGAGACFVGGFLSVAGPTSCHSFRYDGPRPPPSGQTQPESGSEEEDEEEEGEGAEDEDDEGSGDDSAGPKRRKRANKLRERAYPCTFIGKPLGEGVIAPEFLDEDGGSESSKGTGKGNKKSGWQVQMFGPKGADEKRQCKICTGRIPWKQSTTTLDERHFESYHTAHMHVWHHRYHTPSVHLPWETFPHGGYNGVPDGYVDRWLHAKSWPHLAKKKGKASGGARGSGGMERFMTTKLSTVELRQAIAKLVVTCDLPFRMVEAEAFRELLILLNRNCAQKNFIPSRWTVSRDTVVYAAAALQSAIVEMLAKEWELGSKVSFTIDMWTAPSNKAWLVVTGHWIDENFQLRTMVLEFREMLGRHGGREMAQVVEETVVQWGLEGRCLGFTTDNASSNIAAFRRMSEECGGQCFFNSRMHFRTSTQYCWSSLYGLSKTDKKKVESLRLTDADWETLQAVKTFLSPFAKVSKAAEGAAYPTVSMVVPYYNGLIDAMESRLAKGPSPTLQPMIVAALSHLKKYAYITSNEYWIATFLDPSMKAAWFDDAHWEKLHPETDRRVRPRPASGEVNKLVRDRVAEYQARAAELAPRPTPLAPVAEEKEGDEAEDDDDAQFLPSRRRLAARLSASQEAGGGGMVQDDEVSRYLSERVRCDVTALEYWRSATNMQTLRRMARDYLAIPATFVSSEGRRPRGVAPPEFAIEGEGAEEDEEEEGVEADDTASGEDAVVGSSSGALA
ncbi:unnamed protein product [Closterium sp. Naga37s-1]|nr:unnamed protein product [Closterium sp. Naga37s-1]